MKFRFLSLLILFTCSAGLPCLWAQEPSEPYQTHNVILVTTDGLRIQEMFSGMDPILLDDKEQSGVEDSDRIRKKFWRESPEERRQALLPFFWKELAHRGVVFGNQKLGSKTTLANPFGFSYPGYAELLTGQVQPSITSNDPVPSPHETVLEFVRRKLNLEFHDAAAFCSWWNFNAITQSKAGSIFCNAGYEAMPESYLTPGMKSLNALQFTMQTPWDSVRHDAVTTGLALEFMEKFQPRFLYLSIGETDDWAHERRYDRILESAHFFDESLRLLWSKIQSIEAYRDRTTLIITTDHGRGILPEDWISHGKKYPGSEDIWIAVIGPDTPARGEIRKGPHYHLSNIAPTIVELFGLKRTEFNPESGTVMKAALKR
ncbi:MAG TPA: hypothetical protein EYQ50_12075 [Verrucomicrobiales bacterium]|nr:hypothetical protein [Verrucomicrobiales bacterium]